MASHLAKSDDLKSGKANIEEMTSRLSLANFYARAFLMGSVATGINMFGTGPSEQARRATVCAQVRAELPDMMKGSQLKR